MGRPTAVASAMVPTPARLTTRSAVLLVQYIRYAPHSRGRDRRCHHVAAHPQHDVGPEPVDDAKPGAKGQRDEDRESEVFPWRVAVEPSDPYGLQLEAGLRDQAFLGTAGASDQEHSTSRLLSAKPARDRESRKQVPAGPAASDQKSHLTSDCSPTRNPSRAGRCSAACRPPPASSQGRYLRSGKKAGE